MEHQDYLFTIAEVAAAFVGFSMVVGALSSDRPGSRLRRVVIHDVAVIGFIVMGGALAPYALAQTTLATGAVWRITSLGLLVLLAFWIPDIVSPIPGGLRVVLSGAFARQTSRGYQHRRRDNWQQPSVVECYISWAGHGIPLPGGLAFVAPHRNLAFFAGWIPIAKLTRGRQHSVP